MPRGDGQGKGGGRKPKPLKDRLMAKVDKREDGCWIWTGTKNGTHYGQIRVMGITSPQLVHRVSYELFVGKIPAGYDVDHLCYTEDKISNRLCCNPDHLEAVTHQENIQRHYVQRPHWKSKNKVN